MRKLRCPECGGEKSRGSSVCKGCYESRLAKARAAAAKQCCDCGKAIGRRAARCRECAAKEKSRRFITAWREVLLGETELPTIGNTPMGPCEICDQNERTEDSWWCQECQEAIDDEYREILERKHED